MQNATWLLLSSIVLIGIATGITLSLFQSKPTGPILTIPEGASILGHVSYEPSLLTITKGDTIRVQNKDSSIHTVTSGKGINDTNVGMLFDTSVIKSGESADIIIANLIPGDYPFFCAVHPYMAGSLKVIDLKSISANQEYAAKTTIGSRSTE
jgi:plastocyanin